MQMVRDGEAEFSLSEVSRITGWSRMRLHRMMTLSDVSEEELMEIVDERCGKGWSLVAVSDEIRRRTGQARTYHECCPNCGHVLRERTR